MAEKVYLGIDQGSSGTKGALVTRSGELLKLFAERITPPRVDSDVVEQDAEELWSSVKAVWHQAADWAGKNGYCIKGAGFATQRSSVCAWERGTAKPVHPVISWADKRFAGEIMRLKDHHDLIGDKCKIPVSPHYAAPKIAYLQSAFPDAIVGTLDAFFAYHASSGQVFLSEDTMAARTMLYSLKEGGWSDELCSLFKVNLSRLPQITPSLGTHFTFEGVPIAAMLGDQQSALYAAYSQCERTLLNLGTIASLTLMTGAKLNHKKGYASSVFYSQENASARIRKFMIEGISNSCKAVIDYIMKTFSVSSLKEIDQLCASAAPTEATAFFPLGGVASPDWTGPAQCAFSDGEVPAAAKARALVENIAHFLLTPFFDLAIRNEVASGTEGLLVSGGVSGSDYLLQYISNLLEVPVRRASQSETTAIGAGLAAISAIERGGEPLKLTRDEVEAMFLPRENVSERYKKWLHLRERVLRGDVSGLEVVTP
ncbi:MAG: hypothetical protein J5J00_15485 [Deltaproteobacteria bacterium]|nr:hypothetical protein [Deltaproteobacteria bacterium]